MRTWLTLTRHFQAGVQIKRQGQRDRFALSITDSLEELRRLAQTAGLHVVGQTFQALESPHPVRPAHALACFLKFCCYQLSGVAPKELPLTSAAPASEDLPGHWKAR